MEIWLILWLTFKNKVTRHEKQGGVSPPCGILISIHGRYGQTKGNKNNLTTMSEMSNTFLPRICDLSWVIQTVCHAAAALESRQLLQRFMAYFE